MTVEVIQKEIEELEKGKRDAINSYKKDGKYLVIAGPGTGKTYTVTKRIEAILQDKEQGTSPDRILCLTFSDAAAREMRLKLEKENVKNSSAINIYTYHSFCLNLMEQMPEIFDMQNKKLITNIQKQAIVKECLDILQDKIVYNRTDASLYGRIDDIVKGIEAFKHNRIEENDFNNNLKNSLFWEQKYSDTDGKKNNDEEINKIKELWEIYEQYKKLSSEYIDFDDMINNVLKKFEEDEGFLKETALKYDFILVDEYQDTNRSQNEIVFKLAKYCKNILVVGDDDQIIYTFQGASLYTIENFLKQFPDAKVFCLTENRRSTDSILRVSEKLAEIQDEYVAFYTDKGINGAGKGRCENINVKYNYGQIKMPMRLFSKPDFKQYSKILISKNEELKDKNVPVKINEYTDIEKEKLYIVKKIEEIIENNCPTDKQGNKKLSEIAILTKTNAEAEEYASLLREHGIKTQVVRGKNIFNSNAVKLLISYMQFFDDLSNYNSDKLYKFLLSKPFHINPMDYGILQSKKIHEFKGTLLEKLKYAIKLSDETEKLKNIDDKKEEYQKNKRYILKDKDKIQKLIDDYIVLDTYRQGESVKNLIHQMACITGILQSYINLEINRADNISAIKKFLDMAEEFISSQENAGFKDFVDYVNAMLIAEAEILTDKTDKPLNAVQVSTLHSSKGREFEYVFMPNLTKEKYESSSDSVKEVVPLPFEEIIAVEEGIYDKLKNSHRVEDKEKQIKFLNNLKLLYVGMTRAKHSLYLSYSGSKSYFIEKMEDKLKGSSYIEYPILDESIDLYKRNDSYDKELSTAISKMEEFKEHLSNEYKEEYESTLNKIKSLKKALSFTIAPDDELKYDYDYTSEFSEYIDENLQEVYSASSLNTYLKCPKQYLYKYIMHIRPYRNRVDEDLDEHFMEYGDAIHYALENMVNYVKEKGDYPSVEFLYDKFDEKIEEKIDMPDENSINTSKEQILNFYNKTKDEIKNPKDVFVQAEYEIELDGNKYVDIDGVKIGGKIDRLDKNSDGTYNLIDYKTGAKAKEEKDFMPDKKYENYYNQLAIYKYILEEKLGMSVNYVKIVQPQFLDKSFDIKPLNSDSGKLNCEEVKKKYIEAVQNIKEHKFECKEDCKRDKYSFCDFRQFCKSKVI